MKITKYMGMALAIISLTACSSDEDLTSSWQNDPDAMKVNATVGSGIFSRSNPLGADEATQKAFNNDDEISIAAGTQNAVVYKLTEGIWTPKAGYLKWETNTMAITAYYPVADGASAQAFTLPTDQADNTKIVAADYMTYSDNKNKPEDNGELNIEMERKMARVIVKIEGFNDQYITVPTVADVKIKSGAASYIAGTVSGDATAINPYVHNLNGEAAQVGTTYTALVIPTDAKSSESFITMNVAGTALLVNGIPEMTAGKSYTYNLTIGKDAIMVGEVIVSDWSTGTIEGGEAEEIVSVSGNAITLRAPGYLDDASILQAIGSGNAISINGSMNDADFLTLSTWAYYNRTDHPLQTLDLSGLTGLTELPNKAFFPFIDVQYRPVKTLVEVKLPASVTTIGDNAFNGCTSLTTINLSQVTTIGASVFSNCASLKDIDLSSCTAIGRACFLYCGRLGVINAPKLQKLTSYAFGYCGTVSGINLPEVTGALYFEGYYFSTFSGTTVRPGGVINLPKCTDFVDDMFAKMTATGATLKLTAAGNFTMSRYAFRYAFSSDEGKTFSAPALVLNADKKNGGTITPAVTVDDKWGYVNYSTNNFSGWESISYE